MLPALCLADGAYYDVDKLGVPKFVNRLHIDLSQITTDGNVKYRVIRSISKFRSSAGHDSSDSVETCRSMKHYFGNPDENTKIYSPISGTVTQTFPEGTTGDAVSIQSDIYPAFVFRLWHVVLKKPLTQGEKLSEGQLLGHHVGPQTGSDIGVLVAAPPGKYPVIPNVPYGRAVSFFDTLTDQGFAPFKAMGFTSPQEFIISQAERDAHPLTCAHGPGTYPTSIDTLPSVVYPNDAVTLHVRAGWNLLGNSWQRWLSVASVFGNTKIYSVWAWPWANHWYFYSPLMTPDELASYALSKGYEVLANIYGGEGLWVNAKESVDLPLPPDILDATNTVPSSNLSWTHCDGWGIDAVGDNPKPIDFSNAISANSDISSLWVWDNPKSKWYFYSSSLDAQGGTALSDYIKSKGYLDFATYNKKLGLGVGFWVNSPC